MTAKSAGQGRARPLGPWIATLVWAFGRPVVKFVCTRKQESSELR